MLRGEEVVEYLVLKELELTAGRMLRWKAVSGRATWFDPAQKAATAGFQKRVECYRVQRSRGDKKDKDDSSDSRTGEGSSKEPKW